MPNPVKLRAFEATILKTFSNFRVLKRRIVISQTRPQDYEITKSDERIKEEVMELKETDAEVIIL